MIGPNMASLLTDRSTPERTVPVIRLNDDADLREIYTFGRKLGQGRFGVVYEAIHIETETKWAIKVVCKPAPGSSKVKMLENEINILKQVNHSHIIHLKEVYITAKMTYLVTELCVGGDLKQLLKSKKYFTEDETRHIILSLTDAVVYLHKRCIVHRDLKLDNILVKNAPDEDENSTITIKVTDFGLSVQTGGVMTEVCGTPVFMAPETMSGRRYTRFCDVWSIGVIMYMLLCGEPPFVSKTMSDLFQEIMNKEVEFPQTIWATVSDAAKNLLTLLLKVHPVDRMSAYQLLETPWMTGDTTVYELPISLLEIIRHHREQHERTGTPDDLSPSSSEDTPHLSPASSTKSESNCRSQVQPNPKTSEEKRSGTPSTSAKVTKDSVGRSRQYKHKNPSETPGSLQPSSSQSHVGVKSSTQRPRALDKKDISAGHKAASDERRSSPPSKSRTGSCKAKRE